MESRTSWATEWRKLKRGDKVWAVILNSEVVSGTVLAKHSAVPAVTLEAADGRVITSHPRHVRREEN